MAYLFKPQRDICMLPTSGQIPKGKKKVETNVEQETPPANFQG